MLNSGGSIVDNNCNNYHLLGAVHSFYTSTVTNPSNRDYVTYVGKNSGGTIKAFNPMDLAT